MIESKSSLDIQTGEIVIDINIRPDVAVQSSLFQQIINTINKTALVEVNKVVTVGPASASLEGYASLKIKLKGQGVKALGEQTAGRSTTTVVRSEPSKTPAIPAVKI